MLALNKLKFTITGLLLLVSVAAFSQKTVQDKYMVAFYNMENLFDTINDPTINDEEFTPESDRKWGTERYNNKLENLAKVISSMNNGKGPDILGVCEVENYDVLKDLVNTNALKGLGYGIAHKQSRDLRGIDVAMLYKTSVLPFADISMLPVPLPDSVSPTRDVMDVHSQINGNSIHFVICHFPSRSEGKEKSEYKRVEAANVVMKLADSLRAVNPNDNILIMGDFNDEPGDSSMSKVIMAGDPDVKELKTLYNLMYPLKNKGEGSYKYRDEWNMLDQMIADVNLYVGNNGLQYEKGSAGIFAEDWMKQTEPKYLGSPMRTFGGMKYLAGYSDHFPVFIYLTLKK